MADITDIQQAKKWIYASLAAHADITAVVGAVQPRIHAGVADAFNSPGWPYVLYGFLGGSDVDGLGTNRIFARPVFQVIAVDNKSPNAALRKADKAIDDIFKNAVHQLSGDFYFTSRREQPVDRQFTAPTGTIYYSIGGLYRLWVGRT